MASCKSISHSLIFSRSSLILNFRSLTILIQTKNTTEPDVREGVKKTSLPVDMKERERIEEIMRSTRAPYDGFRNYYDLDEVIDAYMDIWYDDYD